MKVLCLMGPTGVGKSDVAVELAARLGGEIVNADSMQVYRYLPIGTASPTPAQFAAVPHHLFAILDPDREPDAGSWARQAAATAVDIAARGRVPILAGGTFFWMRALLDGLDDLPPVPPAVRERVRDDLARDGPEALHARLGVVDPATADRLKPRDSQRLSRAMEVFEATGTPLSALVGTPRPALSADVLRLALVRPRDELYRRIDDRVTAMIANGLVAEVRAVLERGFPETVRPLRASSLRSVVDHVAGRIGADELRGRVAQGHRHYAKRQLTWLRAEPAAVPVPAGDLAAILRAAGAFLA